MIDDNANCHPQYSRLDAMGLFFQYMTILDTHLLAWVVHLADGVPPCGKFVKIAVKMSVKLV